MKKFLSLLLAGALALSLVACGGDKPAADQGSKGKSPDNDLVVALQADATNLDPHIGGNGNTNQVVNEMYEALVAFDENTKIVPALAKSWSVSEDGMSYTFVLEEGVTFHDGEPFNAETIKAVYERGRANPSLSLSRQIGTKEKPNWDEVIVDSEYQVTIKLVKPNNTFLNKLTQVRMVSPKAMAREDAEDYLAKNSAGTGPYVLSERVDGAYTKMVRNENYWREGPKVDSLKFVVVPEDASRIAMLKTGEADFITPVPVTDVKQFDGSSDVKVVESVATIFRYCTLNTGYTLADGRKPFADKRVRQAMNYAFDSEAYANVVFFGYGVEPTSVYSEALSYHHKMTPYKKDLEKAKSLMKEAGFESGFPVELVVDNTTIEQRGAEFLKQQLSEINIDVKLLPNESTANAEITSAPQEETKVQMWYVNWSSGSYDADGAMRSILHGDKFPPAGYNTAFWKNEEFDKLLDDALLMTDTAEIEKAYARAQEIAWEECPWVFLGSDCNVYAQKTYLDGVVKFPGGTVGFRTASLDHE